MMESSSTALSDCSHHPSLAPLKKWYDPSLGSQDKRDICFFVDIRTETNQKSVSGFELGSPTGNLGTLGRGWGAARQEWVSGGDRCFHQSFYLDFVTQVSWWDAGWARNLLLWLLVTYYGDTFHPTSHECPGLWVPAHPVPLTLKLSSPCLALLLGSLAHLSKTSSWVIYYVNLPETLSLLPKMGNPFSSLCSAIHHHKNKHAHMMLLLLSRTVYILFSSWSVFSPLWFVFFALHSTNHHRRE